MVQERLPLGPSRVGTCIRKAICLAPAGDHILRHRNPKEVLTKFGGKIAVSQFGQNHRLRRRSYEFAENGTRSVFDQLKGGRKGEFGENGRSVKFSVDLDALYDTAA